MNSVRLPAGWRWVRSHLLCDFVRGHSTSQLELNNVGDGIRYLRTSDLLGDLAFTKFDERYCADPPPGVVTKAEGELVLTIEGFNRPDGRSTVGVPCWGGTGILNNHVVKFRPKSPFLHKRFAEYAHTIDNVTDIVRGHAVGAIAASAGPALDLVSIPLPPLEEQQAIAQFLDRETARIDATIAAKKQLVGILRERWAAAVSRWTDNPTWPQMPLRRVLNGPLEYGIGEPAQYDEPAWPRYIRTTDITAEGELRGDTFKSLPPELAKPYLLADGDILLTRSGATVGKNLLYREEWGPACFAGYLIRVRADRSKALPEFLKYFAESEMYWSQIKLWTLQATIQNVSAEGYGELIVRIPSLLEQERVVAALRGSEERLSNLRRRLLYQLDLLREHRQAVISAAVTGRIDI